MIILILYVVQFNPMQTDENRTIDSNGRCAGCPRERTGTVYAARTHGSYLRCLNCLPELLQLLGAVM